MDFQPLSIIPRLAHTLKGASATLGLESLSEAVETLEKAIKDSPQCIHPSLLHAVSDLQDQLQATLVEDVSTGTGTSEPSFEPETVIEKLEELSELLKVDDAQAKELFDQHKDLFEQVLKEDAQTMDQLISDYDFPGALDILKPVYSKLKT